MTHDRRCRPARQTRLVLPRILLAAASGTAVSLDRPLQLFHMVPGSFEHALAITGEIAFRAISINRVLSEL